MPLVLVEPHFPDPVCRIQTGRLGPTELGLAPQERRQVLEIGNELAGAVEVGSKGGAFSMNHMNILIMSSSDRGGL
jgi:hypothetical protein